VKPRFCLEEGERDSLWGTVLKAVSEWMVKPEPGNMTERFSEKRNKLRR
jgi:hypothetical protein